MHFIPAIRPVTGNTFPVWPCTMRSWRRRIFSASLFHCDVPLCTKVCPVNATYKTQDGTVLIDDRDASAAGSAWRHVLTGRGSSTGVRRRRLPPRKVNTGIRRNGVTPGESGRSRNAIFVRKARPWECCRRAPRVARCVRFILATERGCGHELGG